MDICVNRVDEILVCREEVIWHNFSGSMGGHTADFLLSMGKHLGSYESAVVEHVTIRVKGSGERCFWPMAA
jgi:hypothetical protein